MMSAVNKNNVDLVKRLLANGTDANYGKTALMYAAFGYKWRVYGTFASQVWPKSNWQLWINCMPYIMQSFMEIIKLLSFSNNISIMYVFGLFSPQKPDFYSYSCKDIITKLILTSYSDLKLLIFEQFKFCAKSRNNKEILKVS